MATKPEVQALFHAASSTISYIVSDPETRRAAVVDPVLDFDAASGHTATTFADRIAATVQEMGLTVDWVLETHVHADHLSAAPYMRRVLGGKIAIGARIDAVQRTFKGIYGLGQDFLCDGSEFDHRFADGETFRVGEIEAHVLHTPGHTPACVSYVIGDAVFCGDTLFMPDYGTARADFPGGDAHTLFRSIQRLLTLPDEIRIFVGHDYAPNGRSPAWETTVGAQKRENKHVRTGISEDEFVAMRQARDATLGMPALLLPSIQVNIRAGRMPEPEPNGISYLKIPLNVV